MVIVVIIQFCLCLGGSGVCVSGFVRGSSGQVCVPESEGCTDASISERYLTVSFAHRVECWEIQQSQDQLVWSREQDSSGKTHATVTDSSSFFFMS